MKLKVLIPTKVFLAENVQLVNQPRIVGINHFLVTLKQNGSDKVFDSIGFGLGEFVDEIDKDKHSIDIVFSIDQIIKDGKVFPQLRIKDLKVKETILS